jgi:hypothetical protein
MHYLNDIIFHTGNSAIEKGHRFFAARYIPALIVVVESNIQPHRCMN